MAQKKNIPMAVIAYFVFFIPLMFDTKKDEFVRYHVRQGLGLFITFFLFRFATFVVLPPLPLGGLFYPIVSLTNIFLLVLLVVGVANAARGLKKPMPVVGKWADDLIKL